MRLLVTGAAGFVGRHVAAEAARRGHHVLALSRSAVRARSVPELRVSGIEIIEADLRDDPAEWVRGVDGVIHLAGVLTGDAAAQDAGTVAPTRRLLDAMAVGGVGRIVLVSSFSVYDYERIPAGSLVDEQSPVLDPSASRDPYSWGKCSQEQLVRDAAVRHGWDYAVLRPGAIHGPGNVWTPRLGVQASPRWWVLIGGSSHMPLTYVENCAEAIVLAAERPGPMALTVNIVDDDPPTQRRYSREASQRLRPRPRLLVFPLAIMRAAASLADCINRVIFRRRLHLPGILVPARLDARFKPLRYSNRAANAELGWQPRLTLTQALDRTIGTGGRASPVPAPVPALSEARP